MTSGEPTRPDFAPGKSEADRARGLALRLLTLKPRTVNEMRERLGRRFQGAVVEDTVSRLLREGLLDDADFARHWRQSRERRNPRSRSLIKRELEQRGVDGDLIDNALEDYDSSDAAYRAVSRYAARQAGKDHAAFDRRVSGHLARRGFEYSIIRKTLDRLREELRISNPTRQG